MHTSTWHSYYNYIRHTPLSCSIILICLSSLNHIPLLLHWLIHYLTFTYSTALLRIYLSWEDFRIPNQRTKQSQDLIGKVLSKLYNPKLGGIDYWSKQWRGWCGREARLLVVLKEALLLKCLAAFITSILVLGHVPVTIVIRVTEWTATLIMTTVLFKLSLNRFKQLLRF